MRLLLRDIWGLRWVGVGAAIGVTLFVAWTTLVPATRVGATAAGRGEAVDAAMRAEPGLRIECRNDDESVKTSKADWGDGRGNRLRRFLRLRVYNDGPGTARGCRVALRAVTEITPDGPRSTEFDGPRPLLWSADPAADRDGKSILRNANPGVADLLYTTHGPDGDQILLKDEGYGAFLRYGRSYDFVVEATSEGVGGASRRVRVRFGPTWDDFEVLGD